MGSDISRRNKILDDGVKKTGNLVRRLRTQILYCWNEKRLNLVECTNELSAKLSAKPGSTSTLRLRAAYDASTRAASNSLKGPGIYFGVFPRFLEGSADCVGWGVGGLRHCCSPHKSLIWRHTAMDRLKPHWNCHALRMELSKNVIVEMPEISHQKPVRWMHLIWVAVAREIGLWNFFISGQKVTFSNRST